MPAKTVFCAEVGEVSFDLRRARVNRRPIMLWFERVRVVVGRNVASTSLFRISYIY